MTDRDDEYDGDAAARNAGTGSDGRLADRSVGVSVPDEHVGAFVAQAFEDPERDTSWEAVVDATVAEEARNAWDDLSVREQVEALLGMADDYDQRAFELLDGVPTDRSAPTDRIDRSFEEAMRCRHNADALRDAIAAAYASGRLADADLVAAVEGYGFDTATIAAREDRLETVAQVYDYDFRPYGGTLIDDGVDERGEDPVDYERGVRSTRK